MNNVKKMNKLKCGYSLCTINNVKPYFMGCQQTIKDNDEGFMQVLDVKLLFYPFNIKIAVENINK
jgi:hypothetical protein